MDTDEIRIKEEPVDDWEPPHSPMEWTETLPSSSGNETILTSPFTVKLEPEWRPKKTATCPAPTCVSPSLNPMTSVVQRAPVTSELTPTSSPQVLPATGTFDKPLNFKLQISQGGGLRLASSNPATATKADSAKEEASNKPQFFVNRPGDGQPQLYMSYANKMYLLQASSGQQLNLKVNSPEKQQPATKRTNTVPQLRHVYGTVSSQLSQEASKTVVRPQVLTFSDRSVSLLKGQGIKSLLHPDVTQKLNLLKSEAGRIVAGPGMNSGEKNVPDRLSVHFLKNYEGGHHQGKTAAVRKRKHTARKSFPQSKKLKTTSLLQEAFLRRSPVTDGESSTTNTVQDSNFEDGNNFPFKIDSVFSLADCAEQPQDFSWEENDQGTSEKKAIKVEEFCKTQNFTQEELLDMCGSSFVVLERLDKSVIASKGSQQAQSKCSDHCRNRTLNYLCMLGLIRCHEKKKRLKTEEFIAGLITTKVPKKEPVPDPVAKQTMENTAVNASAPEFSEKVQTDSQQIHSPSVGDCGSTAAAVSQSKVIGVISTDHGACSVTSRSTLRDTIVSVCSIVSSSTVTTSERPSLKSVLQEPSLSPTSLSVAPSTATASDAGSPTVPCKLSVASSPDVVCSVTATGLKESHRESQQGQTVEDQNLEEKQQITEKAAPNGTLPTDHSQEKSLALSSVTTEEKSEGQPSSVSSTVGGMVFALATTTNNQQSKGTTQTVTASSLLPMSTLVTKTSSGTSGQDSSHPVNVILKFVSLPTTSTQGASPGVYSLARTEDGPPLSASREPVSCSSSAKVTTSVAPKYIKVVRPGLVSTSGGSSVTKPTPALSGLKSHPSQIKIAPAQIKTVPSQVKIAPSQIKIAPAPVVTSAVSLLKGLPESPVHQLSGPSAGSVYVLLNKSGVVLPTSAGKTLIPSTVTSSASSVMSHALPVHSSQDVKRSLLKVTEPPTYPAVVTLSSSVPIRPGNQMVSNVARSQHQGPTWISGSVKGNSVPSSTGTFTVNTNVPKSVSGQSLLKKIIVKTPGIAVSAPCWTQMTPMALSQGLGDVKVIQVSSASKTLPLHVVSSGKQTSNPTILSLKSIDETSSAQTPKLMTSSAPGSKPAVQSIRVVAVSAPQQTSVARSSCIKVIPTCCQNTVTSPARSVLSASTSVIRAPLLAKTSSSVVRLNTPVFRTVPKASTSFVPLLTDHGHVSLPCSSWPSLQKGVAVSKPTVIMAGVAPTSVSRATPSVASTSAARNTTAYVSEALPGDDGLDGGRKSRLKILVSCAPKVSVSERNSRTSPGVVTSSLQSSITVQSRGSVVTESSVSSTVMSTAEAESRSCASDVDSLAAEISHKRKRAKLEKKYPLPPGVVIKSEPLTFGYPMETTDGSHVSGFPEHNSPSLHGADANSTTELGSQSAAASEPLPADLPLDFESSDPPVSFQLTDPAFDSDTVDPPTDLDCPDLEPSACEADRPEYDEPPVLTPVLPLLSSSESSVLSSVTRSSQKGSSTSSSATSKKSHGRKKRPRAAKKRTPTSSSKNEPNRIEDTGFSETVSSHADFSEHGELEERPGSSTSPSSDSAPSPLLTSPLTSLYSSQTSTPASEVSSSMSSSDRIRQLKEMLKKQNEQLEQIRQQRAMQRPLVLTDD